VHLAAGETVDVPLEVRCDRRIFGGVQTHHFVVTAAVLGAGSTQATAAFVQTALLSI
jgi:hypothetical protein